MKYWGVFCLKYFVQYFWRNSEWPTYYLTRSIRRLWTCSSASVYLSACVRYIACLIQVSKFCHFVSFRQVMCVSQFKNNSKQLQKHHVVVFRSFYAQHGHSGRPKMGVDDAFFNEYIQSYSRRWFLWSRCIAQNGRLLDHEYKLSSDPRLKHVSHIHSIVPGNARPG